MPDSKFEYTPIDLATDAIRLVRLIKGSDGDSIRCDLFETFLHQVDGTPYEALSYTWGDSSLLVEITLCGKKTMIRDNLHTALCCLRRSDTDRLLWIDAICIDQESHQEKGHQVGQMRLIYENAQEIQIWLGPSTEDIDLVMELMRILDKRVMNRADYRRNSTLAWSKEWLELRKELNPEFNERRQKGLKDLLGRPWFGRVWVIQEVFNAKRATVLCGWNTVPTRTFVVMPKLLGLGSEVIGESKVATEVEVNPHVKAVLEIMPGPLREHSWRSERPDLFTLLKKLTASKSSDPRDRIYALMGISSDVGSLGFPNPDYAESVTIQNVIQRTVSYLVFGEEGIRCELPNWNLDELGKFDLTDMPKAIMSWALKEEKCETILKLLAQTKLDPNAPVTGNNPPLLIVSKQGAFPDIVQCLLHHPRINVNITSASSINSPLNNAVAREDVSMVRMLLGHKDIDINHKDTNSRSPLRSAVEKGCLQIIKMLLENENIDASGFQDCIDHNGNHLRAGLRTYLDIGAETGRLDVFRLFLNHKMTPRAESLGSALWIAASNGHLDMVRELIDRTRILTSPERIAVLSTEGPPRRWTALHAAASGNTGNHTEVVLMLLSAGAIVDGKDSGGDSALIMSANCGNIMTAKLLLDARASVEDRDLFGRTPLWISCKNGRDDMVKLFIKYGANIDAKDGHEKSALWESSYWGELEVINRLLEAGATIDDYDHSFGCTPLFIAARRGHEAAVKILVRAGAETGDASFKGGDLFEFGPDTVRRTLEFISQVARECEEAYARGR